MAKTILGIDIGYESLKLALVHAGQVEKLIRVPMPEKMLKEGRVVSVEALGELLRSTIKENHLRASGVALVLNQEIVYTRTVNLPWMTEEQLRVNLPYEFRDYLDEDLKQYTFDYAMHSDPADYEDPADRKKGTRKEKDRKKSGKADPQDANRAAAYGQQQMAEAMAASDEETEEGMEVLGAVIRTEVLEEYQMLIRKMGMKLLVAAPSLSAYSNLIRTFAPDQTEKETCILDLGHGAVRIHMFKGSRHITSRILESGLSLLDETAADLYDVDTHLGHVYLLSDHEGCQSHERLLEAYRDIAGELVRVINFYRFSNPDSSLDELWICGGGACIPALTEEIRSNVELDVHTAEELTTRHPEVGDAEAAVFAEAIGIAL